VARLGGASALAVLPLLDQVDAIID